MVIAVKKESDKFLTKNVVYREVLLHRRCLPPTSNRQPASSLPPSAAVVVSAGQPDDLDYTVEHVPFSMPATDVIILTVCSG